MRCQFYFISYGDDTLVVCRCNQVKLLFTFITVKYFQNLCEQNKQASFFGKVKAYKVFINSCINKPSKCLGGHGFDIYLNSKVSLRGMGTDLIV